MAQRFTTRRLALPLIFLLGLLLTLALLYGIRAFSRPTLDPSQPILPGQSLGPVRLGMTEEQVLAALGRPDAPRGRSWQYHRPFLAVLFRKNEMRVAVVLAGLITPPDDPKLLTVPYRTPEGIGMLSTRHQIRAAYGLPYRDELQPTQDPSLQVRSITYPELGLQFMLTNEKVTWICVRPAIPMATTVPATAPATLPGTQDDPEEEPASPSEQATPEPE